MNVVYSRLKTLIAEKLLEMGLYGARGVVLMGSATSVDDDDGAKGRKILGKKTKI